MKNIKRLFLLLIAVGWVNIGFGQVGSYQACNNVGLNQSDMLCGTYATMNWDWESTDCKNWNYKVDATIKNLPHPFLSSSQSRRVREISELGDYKKENGWVLIQRDFGCYSSFQNANSTRYPYFVLYNKHSALLRVFVNAPAVVVQNVAYNYMFKLSADNKATSVTSSAPFKAPDKYLNEVKSNEEALYYYHPEASGGNWIVGEFNLNFDFNIKNAVYSNSKINIDLLLISSQIITAKISGKVVTYDPNDPQFGGVNFASKTDPKTNKFSASSKKLLQYSKDGKESLVKMNEGIVDLEKNVTSWSRTNASLKPYSSKLKSLANSTNPKKGTIGRNISGFFDATKSIGGALGVVGEALNVIDFVGDFTGWWNMFDEGTSGSSITPPTTSTYDLTLEGDISAQQLQTNIVFTLPASENNIANTTYLSYYNSPLGIFNLQNTPVAKRVIYNRYLGYNKHTAVPCIGSGSSSMNVYCQEYQSVKIDNNIIPVINSCSELTFKGMNVAVLIKFTQDPLVDPQGRIYNYNKNACGGYSEDINYKFNHFLNQIASNHLEIVRYDKENNDYIFRTKYYDFRALKDLAINVPSNAEVTLNLIAAFSKVGEIQPVVVSREYALDFVNESSPIDYDAYYKQVIGYTQILGVPIPITAEDQINRNFTASYPFSNGEIPPSIYINGNLSSSFSNNVNSNNLNQLSIALFNASNNPEHLNGYFNEVEELYLVSNLNVSNIITSNRKFTATNSININGGTYLGVNTELIINNGYNKSELINNSLTSTYSNLLCNSFNSNAQRLDSNKESNLVSDILTIAPNPFEEHFTISLAKYLGEDKHVKILDQFGRELILFDVKANENELTIDMSNYPKGLYLVKISTPSTFEVSKVIKQ